MILTSFLGTSSSVVSQVLMQRLATNVKCLESGTATAKSSWCDLGGKRSAVVLARGRDHLALRCVLDLLLPHEPRHVLELCFGLAIGNDQSRRDHVAWRPSLAISTRITLTICIFFFAGSSSLLVSTLLLTATGLQCSTIEEVFVVLWQRRNMCHRQQR